MNRTQPSLATIQEFVLAAHNNFDKVKEMLEREPALLNAKWDKLNESALEASGHMGLPDIANYLLDKGAPITIFAAAMLGRTEEVAAFLKAEPSLASVNGIHGISILYHAALSGKVEIAELLVSHGGGQSAGEALHAAVRGGHVNMVKWLLDRGAEPNTPNFEGKTPLHTALDSQHGEIARLLKDNGGTE